MFHDEHGPLARHAPHQWEFPDATTRAAATYANANGDQIAYVASDVYKVALQTDDLSLWILASTTPTWVAISSGFVAVPATLGSPGNPGQIACDGSYAYICYATDSWAKFPVTTE